MTPAWQALRGRYGAGSGAAILRRAIAAELPHGPALLSAQTLANAAPAYPAPGSLGPVLAALSDALAACPPGPVADALGRAQAHLANANGLQAAFHGPADTMAARAELATARSLSAAAILAAYGAP